jgi:hypothetical protein
MREKFISGEELLKKVARLNIRADDKAKTTRTKKRIQLHNSLTEHGDRANRFLLLRSRNMRETHANSQDSISPLHLFPQGHRHAPGLRTIWFPAPLLS